jgi:23S rRNA pseudouridine2605 synthase
MALERLQKVMAAAGVASRRASEDMIAAGRVLVDGKRATVGQQVDPDSAHIEVDGLPIGSAARTVYLLLHKPSGVTSTTRDRHAATTVMELLPTALVPDGARLYPVGRLDQDSEGLLILTNDGPWAEKVLHPRFGVEREYAVGIRAPLDADQRQALEAGIALEEGTATLFHLRPMTDVELGKLDGLLDPPPGALAWYRATLRQGWKRQLRRMFAAVGVPIERLVRVRIGPVRIDGLRSGRTRSLKAPEVRGLGSGAGRSRDEGDAARPHSAAAKARGSRPRSGHRSGQRPSRNVPDTNPGGDKSR